MPSTVNANLPKVPRRVSLIAQTRDLLLEGIMHQRWKEKLPGERRLCRELQISRWTVRAALEGLGRQGLLESRTGHPRRIVRAERARTGRSGPWKVGYIYPEPIFKLRPFVSAMFDEMRVLVQRMGGEIDVYSGRRYYAPSCARALHELVTHNPHHCWILALSTPAMQRWFEKNGVPVIVGGSLHEHVRLPSINLDYRAVGRHAGGTMIAHGHRHVALLASSRGVDRSFPAGVKELEHGLGEAFVGGREPLPPPVAAYHDGHPAHVCRVLDRLRAQARPPTALLIADSPSLLTTITHLARSRVAVPEDLSVITAEYEPYYVNVMPPVTHYEWPIEEFTKQWRRLLQFARNDTLRPDHRVRIIPRFVAGGTLM